MNSRRPSDPGKPALLIVDSAGEREEAEALLGHVPYGCLIADGASRNAWPDDRAAAA